MKSMIPSKVRFDLDLQDLPARAYPVAQNEQSTIVGGVGKYCFLVTADADPKKRDSVNKKNCVGQCSNRSLRFSNRYSYDDSYSIACECCYR